MLKIISVICLFIASYGAAFAQKYFVCFENDKNKNLKLSICFDENGRALYVKYKGQRDSIPVIYKKTVREPNAEGGIPAYYWTETYAEKYNGKITGEYTFTNVGPYGIDVSYTRKKDGKGFYFIIPDTQYNETDGVEKKKPCF